MSRYSVAEAKNQLPELLREVQKGNSVEITKHGEPVAVVLSVGDYQRLLNKKKASSFLNKITALRESDNFEALGEDDLKDVRDKSTGRETSF
jgi:cellobiose PTS system EIIB component